MPANPRPARGAGDYVMRYQSYPTHLSATAYRRAATGALVEVGREKVSYPQCQATFARLEGTPGPDELGWTDDPEEIGALGSKIKKFAKTVAKSKIGKAIKSAGKMAAAFVPGGGAALQAVSMTRQVVSTARKAKQALAPRPAARPAARPAPRLVAARPAPRPAARPAPRSAPEPVYEAPSYDVDSEGGSYSEPSYESDGGGGFSYDMDAELEVGAVAKKKPAPAKKKPAAKKPAPAAKKKPAPVKKPTAKKPAPAAKKKPATKANPAPPKRPVSAKARVAEVKAQGGAAQTLLRAAASAPTAAKAQQAQSLAALVTQIEDSAPELAATLATLPDTPPEERDLIELRAVEAAQSLAAAAPEARAGLAEKMERRLDAYKVTAPDGTVIWVPLEDVG